MLQYNKIRKAFTSSKSVFAACLVLLLVAGCQLLVNAFRDGRELSTFPHKVHVVQEEMECLDCHEQTAGDSMPSFPDFQYCADCHLPVDEENLLATFFTESNPKWVHAGRQSEEILFNHTVHCATGEESCRDCHEDVASSSSINSKMILNMDSCVACHDRGISKQEDCSVCHRELNEKTPPSSHNSAWLIQHGPQWQNINGSSWRQSTLCDKTIDRCDLCHLQDSCDKCHLNERPRSHNAHWRGRGHGLIAGIDRTNCSVCHKQDTCDRCHSQERPRSHRASYGSPVNRHCFDCHLPLGRSESCGVCHLSAPSHSIGTTFPGDSTHQLATEADCRTCHFPSPHPDNGESCRYCHN